MKTLLVGILLLCCTGVYAEVKPDGAIYPSECGKIKAEFATNEIQFKSICINKVTNNQGAEDTLVISLENLRKEIQYFVVVGYHQFPDGVSIYSAVPAKIEVDEYNYRIYKGEASSERLLLTRIGDTLFHNNFEVNLEAVYVTQ